QIERLRGPIRIGEQVDTRLDQREDVALDPGTILQQDEVDRVCLQPAMRVELAADRRPGAFSRLGDPRRSRFEIEIPASHHLEAGFRKVLYRQRDGGKVERRLGFLRPRQRTWRRDASGHRNKAKNQDQSRQPDHARSPLSGTASTAVPIPRRQASTVIPAAISPKLNQYAAGHGTMHRLSVRMLSNGRRIRPSPMRYIASTMPFRNQTNCGPLRTTQHSAAANARLNRDS